MKNKNARIEIPSLEDASPMLASLQEQTKEIVEKKRAAEAELHALSVSYATTRQSILSDAEVRARKIIGDDEIKLLEASQGRIRELGQSIADLTRAISILQKRIDEEKGRASRTICEMVREEYDEHVAEMCKRGISLYESMQAYRQFTSALEAKGVSWTALNPIYPSFMGGLHDNHSRFAWFLKDAVSSGIIDRSLVPEGIRQ